MPTPGVQSVGDFLGARTFIVSTIKVFRSRIISPMVPIIILINAGDFCKTWESESLPWHLCGHLLEVQWLFK